jgi:excisionase family DNA binding protein
MADKSSTSDLLPLKEVARILKVHKETLRRWDNEGKLKAVRIGNRLDRKYRAEDIIPLLQKKK